MGLRVLLGEFLLSLGGEFAEIGHVFFVVALGVPADDGSIVGLFFLTLDDVLDVGIKFLLGADFVDVLDDLVGLDVELGHVEGQFLLLAEHAHLHVLLYALLQQPSHWVLEQLVPLDPLQRVHHQHPPNHVLNVRVHLVWKHHRLLLYTLQEVNDVRRREGHSKWRREYLPKSSS